MSEPRLQGVSRLRHVPRDAVRTLLQSHGVDEKTVRRLPLDRLLGLCESVLSIKQEHIDQLYEDHRYGSRPHLHVRLLPTGTAIATPQAWSHLIGDESVGGVLRELTLADTDSFDGYTELRIRYQRGYDYLDEEEYSRRLWETRFAFIWVNTSHAFMTVMARDQAVVDPLVTAVARVLGVTPVQPHLTQTIVDAFARPANAARRRFLAVDGVTRTYSGLPVGAPRDVDAELTARLEAGDIPRAGHYAEAIEYRVIHLAVDHSAATLTLSRQLPLSALRTWAIGRLIPIVAAIRKSAPEQLDVDLSSFDVGSFPLSQRAAVRRLAAALVVARYAPHPFPVPLRMSLRRALNPLRSQFIIQEVALCHSCRLEDRTMCGSCSGYDLNPPDTEADTVWLCAQCRTKTGRECAAGHLYPLAAESTIMARPLPAFAKHVMAVSRVQPPFDDNDTFVIWQTALRLARRSVAAGISMTFAAGSRNAVNIASDGAIAMVAAQEDDTSDG